MSEATVKAIKQRAHQAQAPVEEKSYRDLQAEAKDAGIPANQSREDLQSALEDAGEQESE